MLSDYNKRIVREFKESYSVGIIMDYLYTYVELFPEFIKDKFEKQRRSEHEKKLKDNILNEIKSDEKKEKDKDEEN